MHSRTYSRTDSKTYARLLAACKAMGMRSDGEDESGIFYMCDTSLAYYSINVAFVHRTLGKRDSFLVGGFITYSDNGSQYVMDRADMVERELARHQRVLRKVHSG
jgi:hypothetical protein